MTEEEETLVDQIIDEQTAASDLLDAAKNLVAMTPGLYYQNEWKALKEAIAKAEPAA